MKKINLSKKLLSLLLIISVIASSFCGFVFSIRAESVYVDETVVYDVIDENISGEYKGNYSRKTETNTYVLPAGSRYCFPYPKSDNSEVYMTWKQDNITAFHVYTFNDKNISEADLYANYILHGSADGETWYALTVVKDSEYVVKYGSTSQFRSFKMSATDIPEGTNYVKLTSSITWAKKDAAWKHGFIRTEMDYKRLVNAPEITAEYKNYYGVYANSLTNGGTSVRDTAVYVSEIDFSAGDEVKIYKDDTAVESQALYNSDLKAYCFTESGKYVVEAKNRAGESRFEFSLALAQEDTVVCKTVYDDFYNTGKSSAIHLTYTADTTSMVSMSVSKFNDANAIPNDKYYMHAYNHGKDEPLCYAVWESERDIGSFFVDTLNPKTLVGGDFFEKYYALYCSTDNVNWTQVEFTADEGSTELTGKNYISYRLTANKIPDGTRYMKWLSLTTDETKHYGYRTGIIGAGYTTYINLPTINANYKDTLGNYSAPLANGTTAPSEVLVGFEDLTEDVGGVYSITKNGNAFELPENGIISEEGSYIITATNLKGTVTLAFDIDFSVASAKTETYTFSEGETAQTEYERLLEISPEGAPEGFTSGDKAIIINDTAIVKKQDKAWWGLTEGGTKLTVGSDTKGYKKDGYFYFVNQGSDGTKYTGVSITYTVARMSGYPTDAYLSIYTADKYDGNYRLVQPISVVEEPVVGAPAAKVCHAVYYFGEAGSVVKVKYNPNAPIATLWQGSFLSILNLTKLSLPIINASCNGETLVDNSVALGDVKIDVNDEYYWFVTKDGKQIENPADNVLTEDGYYTVTACNYAGASTVSFYLAKKIPVIQLVDASGNFLNGGETVVDDVRAITYNTNDITITLDDLLYSNEADVILDLNGKYVLKAQNDYGKFEVELVLNRPLPTISAYNFQSKKVAEGDTIVTQATYSIDTADYYTITLNGEKHTPEKEFELTAEGTYVIEAVNKAGITTLSFTIKYNPPLPEVTHSGDTVVILDYHNGAKLSDYTYKYEDMFLDASSALRSGWTGFTGSIIRPNITGEVSPYVIYKCAGFESFVLYAVYNPQDKNCPPVEELYELYATVNGTDYVKLDYTLEHDISYITTAYQKYRFTVKDIPDGAKYIKLVINQKGASAGWSRCVPRVEFSYNKANVGLLDVDDIEFMINDALEGESVKVDILNGNTVIPKSVFEKLQDSDKNLVFSLLGEDLETDYKLTFNGLDIAQAMDFNIGITSPASEGLKLIKTVDPNALSIAFNQKGEWGMKVNFAVNFGQNMRGNRYALYKYENGAVSLVDSMVVANNGYVDFTLENSSDYILSLKTDIVKNDEEEEIEEVVTDEEEESDTPYIMVVSRKKFVPNLNQGGLAVWQIVLICVLSAVMVAGITVLIVFIAKGKIKLSKGKSV